MRQANEYLDRQGVVLIEINDVATMGVWSDRDSRDIRQALLMTGREEMPVKYLDAPDVPEQYKLRRVVGEPVPMSVLRAMQAEPNVPWEVRDRLLAAMKWNRKSFGELRGEQPAQTPSDPAKDTFAAHTSSANATKAQRLKASKSSRATTFQQSFFEELEQIPADTLSQLMERARGKTSRMR
jgi:hypothetical protein